MKHVMQTVNAFVRKKSIAPNVQPARQKVEPTQTHVHHVEQENILGLREQPVPLVKTQSIPRFQITKTAQNVVQGKKGRAQVALPANQVHARIAQQDNIQTPMVPLPAPSVLTLKNTQRLPVAMLHRQGRPTVQLAKAPTA